MHFSKLHLYLFLKLRALAPLQIPAWLCEGTIYLTLCWVITFWNKRQIWEHYCHPHALCIVNVGCIMAGSFLPWITMFCHCLNFGGALHLCFAVSKRASGFHSCHIISWLFWQSVGIWDILLLFGSWLCHIYELI